MIYIIIFIFGLSIGSFLNVVICRLGTKETMLFNRSHCLECGTILKWHDLIPLFSFLFQKGKCRYCKGKISWQYPLVELATGLIFVLFAIKFYPSFLNIAYYSLISSFFIIIFAYDLKHYIIPDKIVFPAIFISFAFNLLNVQSFVVDYKILNLIPALIGSGFFLILVLASKGEWMGLGDVKLAFLMGLVLGWPHILSALFLSFVFGAVIGLILIALKRKNIKSQIPFGPFLAGSSIFVMLYGNLLIDWYQGLIY